MSIRGCCPPSTAIPSSKEKALEEENTILREQNAALVEALRNLRNCIIDTRGPDASAAVFAADEILARTESAEDGDD
jgi:hypothetical protein